AALGRLGLNQLTLKLWAQRFGVIAEWFIREEKKRRAGIKHVRSEMDIEWPVSVNHETYTIKARIDRIETLKDGTSRSVDHKTGGVPKVEDVTSGVACQLPLGAWLLEQKEGAKVEDLEYWKLAGR